MRHKLITVVLLLAMMPSLTELLEWGIHAVTHGDFAHSADGSHDEQPAEDEHGCTPLMHACGCHRGAATTDTGIARLAVPPASRTRELAAPQDGLGRLADAPPLRPPIA